MQKMAEVGYISAEVYEETVVEGKKRFHEDAFVIEQMILDTKIKVRKVKFVPLPKLGKGEVSTLALYHKMKAEAIVSDDRRFLGYLEEQGVPFLVPSEFLLYLALSNSISSQKCLEALEKIKDLITLQNYYDAKNALED